MNEQFEVGDIVEHVLNREWVMVLEVKSSSYVCRTKSFDEIEFNDYELQPRKNNRKS